MWAFGAWEGKLEREAHRHTHFRGVDARFSADVCFRLKAHLHHVPTPPDSSHLEPARGPRPLSSMTQGKNLPVLLGETLTSRER